MPTIVDSALGAEVTINIGMPQFYLNCPEASALHNETAWRDMLRATMLGAGLSWPVAAIFLTLRSAYVHSARDLFHDDDAVRAIVLMIARANRIPHSVPFDSIKVVRP